MMQEPSSPPAVVRGEYTKVCIMNALKVCKRVKDLERGKAIHAAAVESGLISNLYVRNTLVDMYAKCGSMEEARRLFGGTDSRDVVSWNILIMGYAENGQPQEAMNLYQRMVCAPDGVTFVAALKACACLAEKEEGRRVSGKVVKIRALEKGASVHSRLVRNLADIDLKVLSTLVDMYAKCGSMVDAQAVFMGMRKRDVVCWNVLILGYADNGEAEKSLGLFQGMLREGHTPTAISYVAALKACGVLGALERGQALHLDICSLGLHRSVLVSTSLIDFYGKCWSMGDAARVFAQLPTRDLVAYTALLAGYSRQGNTDQVFELFQNMQESRLRPNGVTLLCVLTACSHAGLLSKGVEVFESMPSKYGIIPTIEHYTCMVDMLGRANKLVDAVELLETMPFPPHAVAWKAVLGACWKWKNVEVGRLAFEAILRLDDKEGAAYVMMAAIYRNRGMPEEQSRVEAMRRSNSTKLNIS